LAIAPDANTVVTFDKKNTRILKFTNIRDGSVKYLNLEKWGKANLVGIEFSPHQRRLAIRLDDKRLLVYNYPNFSPKLDTIIEAPFKSKIKFSADGNFIYCGGSFWNLNNGMEFTVPNPEKIDFVDFFSGFDGAFVLGDRITVYRFSKEGVLEVLFDKEISFQAKSYALSPDGMGFVTLLRRPHVKYINVNLWKGKIKE